MEKNLNDIELEALIRVAEAKKNYLVEKQKYESKSFLMQLFTPEPEDIYPDYDLEILEKTIQEKQRVKEDNNRRKAEREAEREARLEEIRKNPKPIGELYAMYEEYRASKAEYDRLYENILKKRHDFYVDNLSNTPYDSAKADAEKKLKQMKALLDEKMNVLTENNVRFMSSIPMSDISDICSQCRILINDYDESVPLVLEDWGVHDKIRSSDGFVYDWPSLEMVVGDIIIQSNAHCPKLSEIKGKLFISESFPSQDIFKRNFVHECQNEGEKKFYLDVLHGDIERPVDSEDYLSRIFAYSSIREFNEFSSNVHRGNIRDIVGSHKSVIRFTYDIEFNDGVIHERIGELNGDILKCYHPETKKLLSEFNVKTKEYRDLTLVALEQKAAERQAAVREAKPEVQQPEFLTKDANWATRAAIEKRTDLPTELIQTVEVVSKEQTRSENPDIEWESRTKAIVNRIQPEINRKLVDINQKEGTALLTYPDFPEKAPIHISDMNGKIWSFSDEMGNLIAKLETDTGKVIPAQQNKGYTPKIK